MYRYIMSFHIDKTLRLLTYAVLFCLLLAMIVPRDGTVRAQSTSHIFPETGKTVNGKFLEYWRQHGGLPQQGYPISEELQEKSDTDGKTYTVQYFERAVFELHPENTAPNDVLLSLLGVFLYKEKYPKGAPSQMPNTSEGSVLFKETGHRVGGKFLKYWQEHGALAQQGYPLSEEFTEVSDLDGKRYKVQYFERAVFEEHPENAGTRHEVLLSQLGTFRYKQKRNPDGTPELSPTVAVPATPTAVKVETPPPTSNTNITEYDLGMKLKVERDKPEKNPSDPSIAIINIPGSADIVREFNVHNKPEFSIDLEINNDWYEGQTIENGHIVIKTGTRTDQFGSLPFYYAYTENDRTFKIKIAPDVYAKLKQILAGTDNADKTRVAKGIRNILLLGIGGQGKEPMSRIQMGDKVDTNPDLLAKLTNNSMVEPIFP